MGLKDGTVAQPVCLCFKSGSVYGWFVVCLFRLAAMLSVHSGFQGFCPIVHRPERVLSMP